MSNNLKIGWDISHLEFTIEDHYYFSILKSNILESGTEIQEIKSFENIKNYDVAVLNYPEKPFTSEDLRIAEGFLREGGRIIATGYYNNEDEVADQINSLSSHFGLLINSDEVRDKSNNSGRDDLLVVTSRTLYYNELVEKILFPCTASVKMETEDAAPILLREKKRGHDEKIIGAEVGIGKGKLTVLGTCVFWDNYAIKKYDNLRFSLNLLLG